MQDDNMYFDQKVLLLRILLLHNHILLLPLKNLYCLHYVYDNNNKKNFQYLKYFLL